jgi:hypothetical protein
MSAANAEKAANMGIACSRERRVVSIEISGYDVVVIGGATPVY